MDKKFLNEMEKRLAKEKAALKKDLLSFSSENKKVPNDFKSRYPYIPLSIDPTDQAGEVEIYMGRLALEHALETRLQEVEKAQERIKNNTYGLCEKCGREIERDRLEANPAATLCLACCLKSEKNK
jgi:RNA polymerase-binding transcription factor DksA